MITLPDARAIIDLWERGEREHPIDRALSMLAAFTSETRGALAALPVHRRDALLLATRVAAFGKRLEGVVACPRCSCRIEVSLDLPDSPPTPSEEDVDAVEVQGHRVSFRVPDSRDLAEVVRARDAQSGAQILRARCQLTGPTDEATAEAVDREISRICDPSLIELKMACPQCRYDFVAPLDVGHFLWEEVVGYAMRVLDEVDELACRYGWSESDILALPERRRRFYLEHYA